MSSKAAMDAADRLRIIVLGYIVRGPLGGLAWHHLQYMMGLRDLGHDVYFVEDSEDYAACYDPSQDVMTTDPSYGLAFAARTFASVGLGEHWAYHDAHTSSWFGPCAEKIVSLCADADLLLNLSGVNPLRPWLEEVPRRAFVDTDPTFTQVRHLTDPAAAALARRHTVFFSYGENIPDGDSSVPDDGLPWQATRQPIVLSAWPVVSGPANGLFTTVMQWDSGRVFEYGGRRFGMKSESFGPYVDLPRRVQPPLELAVGGPSAPRERLVDHGWRVRNPLEPTRDPWTYQQYIQQSKAEFSVAKHGYVATNSGWFSDRSAAYLASGRPVVVQDTGFPRWMETGAGVLTFGGLDEACAAIEDVNRRYDAHCRAAREVAEAYFDAGRVLPDLIERAIQPAG
jgi:hypothetical protein